MWRRWRRPRLEHELDHVAVGVHGAVPGGQRVLEVLGHVAAHLFDEGVDLLLVLLAVVGDALAHHEPGEGRVAGGEARVKLGSRSHGFRGRRRDQKERKQCEQNRVGRAP